MAPAIVSLLWPKNEHILAMLMQQFGFDIVTGHAPSDALKSVASACGRRIIPFQIAAEGSGLATAASFAEQLRSGRTQPAEKSAFWNKYEPELVQVITRNLESRFAASAALIDELERLRASEQIAGLLVNETDLPAAKAAALWARDHRVPSFLISHGSNIGEAYTVTRQMLADYLFVFGERGMEPYLDMGVPAERMIVAGNPAWDGYLNVLASRDQYRDAVYKQLQLNAGEPLIVFSTTWNAKLTALQDAGIYEATLRAFLAGCAALKQRGHSFNAVIKDRSSNAEFGKALAGRLALEYRIPDVKYADGDMAVFLCAADVLVAYDSNTFVEAMIAGVPSIGLWTPSTWMVGPALDRRDGIPLVQTDNPEGLADVLQRLLSDPEVRHSVRDEQLKRLPYFHHGNDGRAGERIAAAIADRVSKSSQPAGNGSVSTNSVPPRYAWHELTNPRSVAEKGGTQEYYDHPRHELINLLNHVPRMVLDIGCAGGATALELKKLHPSAVVHGIELSEEAATLAATRMDRILRENVEQMDFTAFGYAPGSIDVVFLPDVLEHLYNPWQLLVKLKPYLSKDAQILASLPNVRNAWLVTQLISGKWDYVEEGLLDVTHIRFFTLKGVIELFGQTGYSIERLGQNVDGRMPAVDVPKDGTISFDMGGATFKNMTAQDVWELRTFQFLVDAKPVF